jgi:hypothetical protein
MIAAVRRFPALQVVPVYLIGVAFRPERAPAFAHRLPLGDAEAKA